MDQVGSCFNVKANDRWKEVIFSVKESQDREAQENLGSEAGVTSSSEAAASTSTPKTEGKQRKIPHPRDVQRETLEEGGRRLPEPLPDDTYSPLKQPLYLPEGFCKQCFTPLADDPDAETLFIFLHALKYSTKNLGTWQTPLPRWAGEVWDGDWRGWAEGQVVPSVVERINTSV